jgi:hypothetical protein
MRIYGANGMAGPTTSAAPRRASASGTFTLPQAEPDTAPARTNTLSSVAGIDALIALQGVEDPTERRRRSVTRGRQALDVLEELKMGVLGGNLDGAVVSRLKTAAAGLKDSSGDRNLDAVIAEIELRVEVELAKLGSDPTL